MDGTVNLAHGGDRLAMQAGAPAARRDGWIATLCEGDDAREREIDAAAGAQGELVDPVALLRALGAARCRPQAKAWIVFGDGAGGYGLAEFDSFVRHGIPVIALVGNDAGWMQIAREQVKMLGDAVGTELARRGRPVLVNVWLAPTDSREGSISM